MLQPCNYIPESSYLPDDYGWNEESKKRTLCLETVNNEKT